MLNREMGWISSSRGLLEGVSAFPVIEMKAK
jgi:hypothetical protein